MKKTYTKPELDVIDLTSREEIMLSIYDELDPLLDGDIGDTSKPDLWD